jgi:hypothetical protein
VLGEHGEENSQKNCGNPFRCALVRAQNGKLMQLTTVLAAAYGNVQPPAFLPEIAANSTKHHKPPGMKRWREDTTSQG